MIPPKLLPIGIVFLAIFTVPGAEHEHFQAKHPNFDHRRDADTTPGRLEGVRAIAADRLRARMDGVQISLEPVTGSPKFIHNRRGFLSEPATVRQFTHPDAPPWRAEENPYLPIKQFLDENSDLFGHGSEALNRARKTREYVTEHNGVRTVVWHQELDGVPIFEALLYGHITKDGALVSLSSQFVPEPDKAADAGMADREAVLSSPPVSARQAVAFAANNEITGR